MRAVTLALLAPFAAGALASEPLPHGTPIPEVECAGAPGRSYALYLPGSYDPARRWPVLYLLDPRGRGAEAMARAVPAAERFGWVVASSNDSRGDGPIEGMKEPLLSMLADTHARLSVDDARVALGGFSAGARAAAFFGQVLKSPPAVVLACGAGFLDERLPEKGLPFAWYGIVGDRDFNYVEMKRLARTLADLGVRRRLALFEGAHAWPPEEAFTEALAWAEAWHRARSGTPSPELLAGLIAAARGMEETRPLEALERWEAVARDLSPLGDVGEAARRARELRASLKKTLREDARRDERDARLMGRLERILQEALAREPLPPAPRVLADLDVPDLKRRASSASSREERLSAERVLHALLVRLSFYLPRELEAKGDAARAVLCRALAEAIGPVGG